MFNKLPWWSAFPLSGGFGLVSVFAPDAFPQWLRITLFWIGVALLVGGIVAAMWHFRPRGLRLPTLRRGGSLYVGEMFLSDSQLDQKHYFDLSIRVFNGTGFAFRNSTVEGPINVNFSANGSGVGGFTVPTPVVYFETERPHLPDKEFMIATRLFLDAAQVTDLRQRQADGQRVHVMFEDFKVFVETKSGKRMQLPLWNGISIAPNGATGRVSVIKMNSVIGLSEAGAK